MRLWLFITVSVIAFGCDALRCKRADGPRRNYDLQTELEPKVVLALVANLSLDIDTNQNEWTELVAQEEVEKAIEITNTGGISTLQLGKCLKQHSEISIYSAVHQLSEIEITSAGTVSSASAFFTDELRLKNNGIGELDISMVGQRLWCESHSSGNTLLGGYVRRLEFLTTASGDLNAYGMPADTVVLHVRGSSVIEVQAESHLEVHFYGNGTVKYRGAPASIVTIGTGQVIDDNPTL